METLAISVLASHYGVPMLCYFSRKKMKWSLEIAAFTYVLTLIGLYVLVCCIPEFKPLRIWLMASTIICWLVGMLHSSENNSYEDGPGCVLLIPSTIGIIIWLCVL